MLLCESGNEQKNENGLKIRYVVFCVSSKNKNIDCELQHNFSKVILDLPKDVKMTHIQRLKSFKDMKTIKSTETFLNTSYMVILFLPTHLH